MFRFDGGSDHLSANSRTGLRLLVPSSQQKGKGRVYGSRPYLGTVSG